MRMQHPNLAKLELVANALGAMREKLAPDLRQYLAAKCRALLAMPGFMNALPGMVFPDESLAERVKLLALRFEHIGKLDQA